MAPGSGEQAPQTKTRPPEGDRVASPARPQFSQPSQKSKKKRASSRSKAIDIQHSNSDTGNPATPSKPAKTRSSKTPATDAQHGRNPHKGKQRNSSALKENVLQEHMQDPSQDMSATPGKAMQVYAGPTFHASPAPSSLPIPKMFSKSVPQVNDKTASLKAMMHEDLSEDSSFSGDGSPTLRNSTMASNERTRDVSPLDIFFKADKQERERRADSREPSSSLQTPPHNRRAQSSSPVSGNSVPPPQPYDNAMFSLESDGEVFGSRPSSKMATPPPPPPPLQQNDPAAQARAKTEALKQLLRFAPSPQSTPGVRAAEQRSSSSRAFTPPTYERRHPSLEPGGRPSSDAPNAAARLQSQIPDRQDSRPLHELNSNTPVQRASSQSSVALVDHSRSGYSAEHAGPRNDRQSQPRPPTQFSAQDALNVSQGRSPAPQNSTAAMEEQLRKILKLDGMSSDGVR